MKKLLTLSALFFAAVCARAVVPLADPISISITSVSSVTGTALQVVDLSGTGSVQYASRDKVSVEVEVVNNSTAPGASRTVTVYYGFASVGTYTAAQMGNNASNQVLSLANSASVTRVYTLPVVYSSGRYLYLWLDHTARDAGSTLAITVRVLGVGK